MKRLLCLSGMNLGGTETFLMKVYRNIDRTCFQFDFYSQDQKKAYYENEIEKLGGTVFHRTSTKRGLPNKLNDFSAFLESHREYDAVLATGGLGVDYFFLRVAQKNGIRIRAARASCSDCPKYKDKIIHYVGRGLFSRCANLKFAPSALAAKFYCGNRVVKRGDVHYLPNGLDLEQFCFSKEFREQIRDELRIKDKLVLGHVGRFDPVKNHLFLLDIIKALRIKGINAVLLLVGDGKTLESVKERANLLGLVNDVRFIGRQTNVSKYLSAMDVFVFPSFNEGMPNAVVEAQMTGLPCLVSSAVTSEVNITGHVHFLSIHGGADIWADKTLSLSEKSEDSRLLIDVRKLKDYDIKTVADRFIRLIFGDTGTSL